MDVDHEVTLLVNEIHRLGSKRILVHMSHYATPGEMRSPPWPMPCEVIFIDADGKISVKFGVLFNDDKCANLFEALVGTLKAAKRKKVITFQGELLLQGVHDNVDVILLQE